MENQTTNIVPTPQPPADNSKLVAIISYFSLVGWLIALILNNSNKTSLGSYHIRQSLMILICVAILGVASWILLLIPIVGWIAAAVLGIGLFVLWIIGLVNAINGQEKPLPIIGDKANELLKGVA
ncbi:MAG: DUF4870 domain-containing protein [Chitinophagaceae bacterium]